MKWRRCDSERNVTTNTRMITVCWREKLGRCRNFWGRRRMSWWVVMIRMNIFLREKENELVSCDDQDEYIPERGEWAGELWWLGWIYSWERRMSWWVVMIRMNIFLREKENELVSCDDQDEYIPEREREWAGELWWSGWIYSWERRMSWWVVMIRMNIFLREKENELVSCDDQDEYIPERGEWAGELWWLGWIYSWERRMSWWVVMIRMNILLREKENELVSCDE